VQKLNTPLINRNIMDLSSLKPLAERTVGLRDQLINLTCKEESIKKKYEQEEMSTLQILTCSTAVAVLGVSSLFATTYLSRATFGEIKDQHPIAQFLHAGIAMAIGSIAMHYLGGFKNAEVCDSRRKALQEVEEERVQLRDDLLKGMADITEQVVLATLQKPFRKH
jgi:hypothetical protein